MTFAIPPIHFIRTYISMYVPLSLCSLRVPLPHAPELAGRRPDSSGPAVLRGCGVGGKRACGLCGHVQGVPPRDSLSLGALPRHTGPAQLCHTHLLPGAHLHLQDTACQEVEVRTYTYIPRHYRGCVNTLHTHHCNSLLLPLIVSTIFAPVLALVGFLFTSITSSSSVYPFSSLFSPLPHSPSSSPPQ